jgi:uncharacterized protein with PIN domain
MTWPEWLPKPAGAAHDPSEGKAREQAERAHARAALATAATLRAFVRQDADAVTRIAEESDLGTCPQCGGKILVQPYDTADRDTGPDRGEAWECLNCGEQGDVIGGMVR